MKNLNAMWVLLAITVATFALGPARAAPPECTPAGDCTVYKHRVTYPANALSYGWGAFTLHPQGLDWPGPAGTISLTVRRPPDFKGDKVRLTVVHQTTGVESGTLSFPVIAIAFHHGSSFETYGGFASDVIVPVDSSGLYEQSAVIEPGEGWNPDGRWWYFELGRHGTYVENLRVMAVTLEY